MKKIPIDKMLKEFLKEMKNIIASQEKERNQNLESQNLEKKISKPLKYLKMATVNP